MAKIDKKNLITISNSELLAVAGIDEKTRKVTLYTLEEVTMETLEKMLKHLTNDEPLQNKPVD